MKQPSPLKRVIFESGRTQGEIAEALDMHPSHLSRVVNGLHVDDATRDRILVELRTTLPEITLSDLWPATAAA